MSDPNPRPIGPQGDFGNPSQPSDPPLSPKASDVYREEEISAVERAQEARRIPEPVPNISSTRGPESCVEHARRALHDMVASNPSGTLAVAFSIGLLCGICAARMDYR